MINFRFSVFYYFLLFFIISNVGGAEDGTTTEIPTTTTENAALQVLQRALISDAANITSNDVNSDDNDDKDLDTWEPPEWISKNYPFYLSGYDADGRPIWISEWGKFDLRKIVESGEETQQVFQKYVRKAARLVHNITMLPTNPLHEINVILDFDGLRIEQFASIPTVRFAIGIGLEQRGLIEAGRVSKLIVVNANYLADTFLRLAKSVFGRLFEVLEVHGTSRASWIPQLLRHFPRDQLPEWYGGTKYHKPVAVYG